MVKARFCPPPTSLAGEPFGTAEEAWLWGMRGQRARLEGARLRPGLAEVARPCEAVDVVRAAGAARRSGRLGAEPLGVMLAFGWRGCPPDPLLPAERAAARLWAAGLDALAPALVARGILRAGDRER